MGKARLHISEGQPRALRTMRRVSYDPALDLERKVPPLPVGLLELCALEMLPQLRVALAQALGVQLHPLQQRNI